MAAFRGIISRVLFARNTRTADPLNSAPRPAHHLISCRGVASKLFVGDLAWPYVSIFGAIAGLSFYTTEEALSESFSQFGQVIEAKIISDRVSDRSKGFGFITFASEDEAQKACEEMNGKVLNGRVIYVDTAKPSRTGYSNGVPIARGPPEPVHH
ncbi:hypothetical protein IFM89_025806 [Coptis chinensis]|uniref:RRM domain-containing protein n=1 Tax=Coptis chinensis TaxID=261450 RepID=A0A835HGX5_9MAGN|nr:hypothetical protein IFM89_025806 [Coptis chinensis]